MDTISVDRIAESVEREFDRLRIARPHLHSRIERAENILITHIACPAVGIIKPRIRAGELVSYLVKGSGGAVYKVDPHTFSCSCPDYHRRGAGCKHGIACYALGRAFRPSPLPRSGRRCDAKPKITRHEIAVHEEPGPSSSSPPSFASDAVGGAEHYEERECVRCLSGFVYDGQHSEWTACPECAGTGRSRVFIYSKEGRIGTCAGCGQRFPGRELIELQEGNHDNLTYFHGDLLCEGCARAHGVL